MTIKMNDLKKLGIKHEVQGSEIWMAIYNKDKKDVEGIRIKDIKNTKWAAHRLLSLNNPLLQGQTCERILTNIIKTNHANLENLEQKLSEINIKKSNAKFTDLDLDNFIYIVELYGLKRGRIKECGSIVTYK